MANEIETLYAHFKRSTGISTDTRSIQQGNLFFALKGPNFNANRLAAQALEKGASLAVIDDPEFDGEGCFLVADVLTTLQQLATHHRRQLDIPVIGLTGSNGKTSTKELIRDVLATQFKVWATQGNLNNHIGVPLTLLSITSDIEMAVIEMGANHVGEIALLTSIAEPTHGLITNIGKAHLEGFGGIQGVIKGKSEMYDFLIKTGGVIFVNTRQPILKEIAEKRIESPYYYPQEGDYLHIELVEDHPVVIYRNEAGAAVTTQIKGGYNFDNIGTALCIGKYFGIAPEAADKAIAAYVADNNRSQEIRRNGYSIILDAYNANPTSMAAALKNLGGIKGTVKTAILGDMFELGDTAEAEHREIGLLCERLGIDHAIFCGELMQAAAEAMSGSLHFNTRDALADYLRSNAIAKGHILIKGSRGMGLEAILELIA